MIDNLLANQEADGRLRAVEQKIAATDERKKYVTARKFLEKAPEKLDALDARAEELKHMFAHLQKKSEELAETVKDYENLGEMIGQQGGEIGFYKKNATQIADALRGLKAEIARLRQSVEEAAASVAERRKSEMFRYSHLYGVNIKDTENYNYVIDTSYISPERVAERIAAHYEKYAAGGSFLRYDVCPARLLPCGVREGEPAFFEKDGFYCIASGEEEIAARIRAGEELISLKKVQGSDALAAACTQERVAAWQGETGIRPARLPFAK